MWFISSTKPLFPACGGFLNHGGSPSHQACFNAMSWSSDLDDLGVVPFLETTVSWYIPFHALFWELLQSSISHHGDRWTALDIPWAGRRSMPRNRWPSRILSLFMFIFTGSFPHYPTKINLYLGTCAFRSQPSSYRLGLVSMRFPSQLCPIYMSLPFTHFRTSKMSSKWR